jgi:hypothetical protein
MNKLKYVLLLLIIACASYSMNADREEDASKLAIELPSKMSSLEVKDNGEEKKEEENPLIQLLITNNIPGLQKLTGISLAQDAIKRWAAHYYNSPEIIDKTATINWVLFQSNFCLRIPSLQELAIRKAAELVLTQNLKIDGLPQDIKNIFWFMAPTFSFLKNQIADLSPDELFYLNMGVAHDTIEPRSAQKVKYIAALKANYIRQCAANIKNVFDLFKQVQRQISNNAVEQAGGKVIYDGINITNHNFALARMHMLRINCPSNIIDDYYFLDDLAWQIKYRIENCLESKSKN